MIKQEFYPITKPFDIQELDVEEPHKLHLEQIGNPSGIPVMYLHGGPGSGCEADVCKMFDPDYYRLILLDQRGAGKSTPLGSLVKNTTWHLVKDLENLREALNLERWILFGGSWGSSLALIYAQEFPHRVAAMVLRGIFLCRKKEIDWFYQDGARMIYPDAYSEYIRVIPDAAAPVVESYYKLLTATDEATRLRAALAWSKWESATKSVKEDTEDVEPDKALAVARLETHYLVNNFFLEDDDFILRNLRKIRSIPTWLVHGRYDIVAPLSNAWSLKKAFPEAQLIVPPTSGHSYSEPETMLALLQIMEKLKSSC